MRPDIMFFMDSIYYMTPSDLLHAVIETNSKMAYIVCHDLRLFSGEIKLASEKHPEAVWSRDQEDSSKITFRVQTGAETGHYGGPGLTYRHADIDWLLWQDHYTEDDVTVAWDIIEEVGCHLVLRAYVTHAKVEPPRQFSLSQALDDQTITGSLIVDRGADVAKLTGSDLIATDVDYESIYALQDTLFVMVKHKKIALPRSMVAYARTSIFAQRRDPTTWHTIVSQLKRRLRTETAYTDTQIDAMLPHIAYLGYVGGIDQEINVMNTVASHQKRIAVLNGLLDFQRPKQYNLWKVLTFLLAMILLMSRGFHWASGSLLTSQGLVTTLWVQAIQTYEAVVHWINSTWLYTGYHVVDPVRTALHYGPPLRHLDVCMRNQSLKRLRSGAKVTTPPWEECIAHHGLSVFGFAVCNRASCVARSCCHNEYVAVVNRALFYVDPADEVVWASVGRYFAEADLLPWDSGADRAGRSYKTIRPVTLQHWLDRFLKPRRQNLTFFNDLADNGLGHDETSTRDFNKREHANKVYPIADDDNGPEDGVQLFDPRLIRSTYEALQCRTGPWIYSFSKYVATAWGFNASEPVPQITYAAGLNLHTLGQWYDKAFEELSSYGQVAVIDNDISRYDGRISVPALCVEFGVYRAYHCPQDVLDLLEKQKYARGQTAHGVLYHVPGTRQSGVNNTSVGNSIINAAMHAYILHAAGVPNHAWRLIVMGDDCLLLILTKYVPAVMQAFKDYAAPLGMVFKAHASTDLASAQFCSKRPYPTDEGTVWGLKIGRFLTKQFSSMHAYNYTHGLEWVRGVAKGLAADVQHIPLLRVIVNKSLELTEGLNTIIEPVRFGDIHWHTDRAYNVCQEVYATLASWYDLMPADWARLEQLVQSARQLPVWLEDVALKQIMDVDVPNEDRSRFVNGSCYRGGRRVSQYECLYLSATRTIHLTVYDLYAVLLAPLLEESLGSVISWFPLALCVLEFRGTLTTATIMHLLCWLIGPTNFYTRFVLHLANNIFATLFVAMR